MTLSSQTASLPSPILVLGSFLIARRRPDPRRSRHRLQGKSRLADSPGTVQTRSNPFFFQIIFVCSYCQLLGEKAKEVKKNGKSQKKEPKLMLMRAAPLPCAGGLYWRSSAPFSTLFSHSAQWGNPDCQVIAQGSSLN